ncbi:hypothetical protein TQ29_14290 [Actibacterium sp. EMB200-NS6]|nr:hypothetical protein TQ29_14290 [Actibacterium sp. EMB200-NS6]
MTLIRAWFSKTGRPASGRFSTMLPGSTAGSRWKAWRGRPQRRSPGRPTLSSCSFWARASFCGGRRNGSGGWCA